MLKLLPLVCLLFTPAQAQPTGEHHAPSLLAPACEAQIVSYQAWAKNPDSTWIFHRDVPAGGLYYFGAEHANDPAHPQFEAIEAAFERFRPTLIFYEGPVRPLGAGRRETIEQYGESGFVRFLAQEAGLPVARLEPDPVAEAQYVLQSFSPEQVKLFYVLRETARLRERLHLSEPELREAVARLLERAAALPGFENVLLSLDDLEASYRKYWSGPAAWWQAPAAWFDPLRASAETGGIFTNDVNRVSSHFRNLHMARVLAAAVLRGERVFAVVGRNHVPLQVPALRCALG